MEHTYRLLLDEGVEDEVTRRLAAMGHDVEHVASVSRLGKGSTDADVGVYSIETDRFVVTYDDDVVLELEPTDYRAVLYFDDASTSAEQVAAIVDAMSELYPPDEFEGLVGMGRDWL